MATRLSKRIGRAAHLFFLGFRRLGVSTNAALFKAFVFIKFFIDFSYDR
jgi:hypothetical protein